MHQRPGHQPVPRPRTLVAAVLAVLALLIMHALLVLPEAAGTAAPGHAAHGHAGHAHTHDDHPDAPHSHSELEPHAHLTADSGPGHDGHPCTTCPGCGHDTASACALTPAKAGGSNLLVTMSDLAPAPHEIMSWPTYAGSARQATPSPPSLIALSISRT